MKREVGEGKWKASKKGPSGSTMPAIDLSFIGIKAKVSLVGDGNLGKMAGCSLVIILETTLLLQSIFYTLSQLSPPESWS